MKPILVALIVLTLAGCAQKQDARATVSASQASLAASGKVAMAYLHLPVCPVSAPVCGTPSIRNQIKVAFDQATDALNAAQATADAGGTPDMVAATTALKTLQELLAVVKQ